MMGPNPEFSRPLNVERLSKGWTQIDLTADSAECRALADRFGIIGIEALTATVRLKRLAGSRMVRLDGRLCARVVQACSVTSEPLLQDVDEAFSLDYAPMEAADDRDEISFSYEEADPPEPIVDGVIDIGEAVAEHLALSLDPFPRHPLAEFKQDNTEEAGDEGKPNPFAALEALRKNADKP